MLSCIQEYAPPGPQVGSIPFDFVTKSDGMLWSGRGTVSPIGQTVQMLLWQFRTGLTSWASLVESGGCLRLANQRRRRVRTRAEFSMAARCEWPGHPDPDGPATKASVPETSAVLDSYVEASATPLSKRSAPFSQGRSHLGFPD